MPYKKPRMTPKAASRERSKLRAQGRFRGDLLRPPEIQSGVVMPVGAAIGAVYRAAASRRTTNAMMTPSQRRRANVDPVVVQKRLASLERRSKASPESQKRARASAARTKRSSEARQMDKMDDAARQAELTKRNPNKMVRRPRFTAAGNKRLAERKEALNSPTRRGYKQPAGGAKENPREAEMRRRAVSQPSGASAPESMRFLGRATRAGYQPAGRVAGAPDGVKRRVKVSRRLKPAPVAAPRRPLRQADGTDRYGNRPGMTDAERMQARQKWREAQEGKPAKPKAPNPREMEANKAAIAGERIRPVAARPKTKVSTKIKAEEERVSKQNPKAAEREAKAKADAAKARGTASPYKASSSTTRRSADVAARRAAADERLKNDLASRKKGSRKP